MRLEKALSATIAIVDADGDILSCRRAGDQDNVSDVLIPAGCRQVALDDDTFESIYRVGHRYRIDDQNRVAEKPQ